MNAFELSISAADLTQRVLQRLRGTATGPLVLWQDNGRLLLLHLDAFAMRIVDGWLIGSIDLETDQTGRRTLQFVFCLGKRDGGDGSNAACTINAADPQAAILADAWGKTLQRVLWDGVLDVMESALTRASRQAAGGALSLDGFFAEAQNLTVRVLVGE